ASDVWVPVDAHAAVLPSYGADLLTNRRWTMFGDAFGRLRPGASMAQAQQQASAIARASDFSRLPSRPGSTLQPLLFGGMGQHVFVAERLTAMWRLLMAAVGLVLLLACANAANLLLARALARRREIAVCQAIGASRVRIVRQHLVEGMVLSLIAGGVGLLLAV